MVRSLPYNSLVLVFSLLPRSTYFAPAIMSSLSSNEERNFGDCSPSESSCLMGEKSYKVLDVMLREHDEDLVITEFSLPKITATYLILDDFDLHALEVGQHPFDPFPNGFSLSVDALEVGVRFPLHPLIVLCL
ncbi:hypothetical protein GW17_00027610, partial [Ensete ventricosum]